MLLKSLWINAVFLLINVNLFTQNTVITQTHEPDDDYSLTHDEHNSSAEFPEGVEESPASNLSSTKLVVMRDKPPPNIPACSIASSPVNFYEGDERLYPETNEDNHNVTILCSNVDLTAVKCNRTLSMPDTFLVSHEAVLFLKGTLVTRVVPSVYIFLILISLPLNALALVTFTLKNRAKKPAVIYMSHLACVDLLFTLLLPLKIHYHLNGSDWVFGEVACRLLTSVYYCYMYCSILLMMCMSVDRFVAVVLPVASLSWRSAKNAMFICVLVWLLALAGTVPLLSMKQTFKIKNVGVTCHDALHHDDPEEQQYVYVFFILSCLYYFLPLVVTLVSYSSIIYVLCTKPDRLTTSSSSSNKRRRAVIMAIAVLVEFVVCFASTNGILLYHCVLLAMGGHSEEGDSSYTVYMLAVCAGSSSVLLDPLLYYYGSSQCRQQIGSLFWWRKKAKRGATLSSSNTRTKSSHLNCDYSKAQIKV